MTDTQELNTSLVQRLRRISPLLVIFLISGVIGAVVALIMVMSEERSSAPPPQPAQVINPSSSIRPLRDWQASDFTLKTLDGSSVSLSDYMGKIVFLNFWRTDCAPCVREMPALQEFVKKGDHDAVVLAINQGEDVGRIAPFLDQIGVNTLTVLLDEDLEVEQDYPLPGLPTTYVISKDGFVAFSKIGEVSVDEMYTYLDELTEKG